MRLQILTGALVLSAALAAGVNPIGAAPVELALLAGGGFSDMGSGRGLPLTLRVHAIVEPGVSYGLEGGYIDWGEKSEVCASQQIGPCEDGLQEALAFVAVSGKWRGGGEAGHGYFSFGLGVYRRAQSLAGSDTQGFGGGFDVAFGYERTAPIAPVVEITLRVAGADRDMLTMIALAVGLSWSP